MPDPLSPQGLAKAVHDSLDGAMAALPTDKRGAVLIDATTAGGVRMVYAQRVNQRWRIGGEWAFDGSHHAGKVMTEFVW